MQNGEDAFPFTDIRHLHKPFRRSKSALENFLAHEFLPETVMFPPHSSHRYVWVYLFYDGKYVNLVRRREKQCREFNDGIKILVIYAPSCTGYYLDLRYGSNTIKDIFQQANIDRKVLPFNNSRYRSLDKYMGRSRDQVIIYERNGGVDCRGREYMSQVGVQAYPFFFGSLVQNVENELRQVTLQSLFEKSPGYIWEYDKGNANDLIPVERLGNKNVLLYIHHECYLGDEIHPPLAACYKTLKVQFPDLEVVFFPIDGYQEPHEHRRSDVRLPSEVPWLICLDNPIHSDNVSRNFFSRYFHHVFDAILAFGKDGKISSLFANQKLSLSGEIKASPFDSAGLHDELITLYSGFISNDCCPRI